MEWQPIETAPRDGTLFLVWADGDYSCVWQVGEVLYVDYTYDLEALTYSSVATHWMPLPAPPN